MIAVWAKKVFFDICIFISLSFPPWGESLDSFDQTWLHYLQLLSIIFVIWRGNVVLGRFNLLIFLSYSNTSYPNTSIYVGTVGEGSLLPFSREGTPHGLLRTNCFHFWLLHLARLPSVRLNYCGAPDDFCLDGWDIMRSGYSPATVVWDVYHR
jgi:hypothetical protein